MRQLIWTTDTIGGTPLIFVQQIVIASAEDSREQNKDMNAYP